MSSVSKNHMDLSQVCKAAKEEQVGAIGSPGEEKYLSSANCCQRDMAVQSSASATTAPDEVESLDEEEARGWSQLPGELLEVVFSLLPLSDLGCCSQTCCEWRQFLQQDAVWKNVLARDFKQTKRAKLREIQNGDAFVSWKEEYRRLRCDVPAIQVQLIRDHRDEVLHVSFAHDGNMFATCSKDGFVKCWDALTFPFRRRHQASMKSFSWKYTQYSAFNYTDTLLLVSGVHFGPISTSGELVVFNIHQGFTVQCKVRNKPYDIFGSWLDSCHLFSGNLHWTGAMESCCSLWISRASQELESERIAVMRRAYKFLNVNGSSLRTLVVAHPHGEEDEQVLLIFSTGSRTYIPHQIGIKKLKKSEVPIPGITAHRSLQEAIEEHERQLNSASGAQPEMQYDAVDHFFDLNAQIIGLTLSPDQRYLFANCRSWPDNAHIEDPFLPPPISSEVEIRCFDLHTLQAVPKWTYRAHRAYTPSEECFFIFMDVANDFVASGAEDSKGYIWHRHHNILLSCLPHQSVVNSVAFNPADQETLVTVSDDYTIRVWFSRRKCQLLGLDYVGQKVCGVDKSIQCFVEGAESDEKEPLDVQTPQLLNNLEAM